MLKVCKICGCTFETEKKAAKYCGDKCRYKGLRASQDAANERYSLKVEAQAKEKSIAGRKRWDAKRILYSRLKDQYKADKIANGHDDFFMAQEFNKFDIDFESKFKRGEYDEELAKIIEESETNAM